MKYFVKIRESIMIAHSLPDPFFGPAQNMHGATFTVDVTFISDELNEFNVVIDMGEAHRITKEVLSELNYKNLDELPQFKNQLSTTEHLATYIQKEIKKEALDVQK
jgi:6-pyruvoyl-tetrahydropterin synthase